MGRIRQKVACFFPHLFDRTEQQNFERLKNREDGSDFDDFWTEIDRDDPI